MIENVTHLTVYARFGPSTFSLHSCTNTSIFPDMNECGSAAIMEGETSRLIALFISSRLRLIQVLYGRGGMEGRSIKSQPKTTSNVVERLERWKLS